MLEATDAHGLGSQSQEEAEVGVAEMSLQASFVGPGVFLSLAFFDLASILRHTADLWMVLVTVRRDHGRDKPLGMLNMGYLY